MTGTPERNIDKITGSLEGAKSIETIIKENPNANIDEEQYREFLTVRLDTEEENLFIHNQLNREMIEKISSLKRNMLQTEQYRLENQQERQNKVLTIQGEGDLESSNAREEAESLLGSIEEVEREVENADLTSEKKKQTGVLSKVKDKASEVATGSTIDGWIGSLEKIRDSGGFLGILATIALFFLKGLRGLIGIFEKKEKVEGGIKNITELVKNPEYPEAKKQFEEKTFGYIEKSIGVRLTNEEKTLIRNKLDPKNEKSYVSIDDYSFLIEKIKKGEKIDYNDLHRLNIIEKIMNDDDPDIRKIYQSAIEKAKERIYNELKQGLNNIGVNIVENSDNEKRLKNIISRKISESRLKTFINEGEGSFLDIGLIGVEGALFIPNIIWEMWKEEIIDVSNLAIGAAERGGDRISLGLQALTGIDIIPQLAGEINFGTLEKMIDDLDETKKILLLRSFYSELGLIGSVLGSVGYATSSVGINLFEKIHATGSIDTKNLQNILSKLNDSPIDKLGRILEKLEGRNGAWLKDVKDSIKMTLESYKFVGELNNPNLTPIQRNEIITKIQALESDFKNIVSNNKFLSNGINTKALKGPLKFGVLTETFDDIGAILKTNSSLALDINSGNKAGALLEKIDSFKNSFKLRRISGNVVMHLSEGQSLRNLLNATKDLAPSTIKFLFGRIPMILVGTSLLREIKNEITSGTGSAYETLLALNGIFGGLVLLDEAKISIINGTFDIKDAGKGALGLTVLGIEGGLIVKDTIKYMSGANSIGGKLLAVPRAVGKSIIRIPLELYDTTKWGIKKGGEIAKIGKAIIRKSPKNGIIAIGALALGAILLYAGISEEDIGKIINEKGLIDKEGNVNILALKKEWKKLKDEDKLNVLKLITTGQFPKEYSEKDFDFKLTNNTFTIQVKNDFYEKSQNELLNIKTSLFNMFFTISPELNLEVNPINNFFD